MLLVWNWALAIAMIHFVLIFLFVSVLLFSPLQTNLVTVCFFQRYLANAKNWIFRVILQKSDDDLPDIEHLRPRDHVQIVQVCIYGRMCFQRTRVKPFFSSGQMEWSSPIIFPTLKHQILRSISVPILHVCWNLMLECYRCPLSLYGRRYGNGKIICDLFGSILCLFLTWCFSRPFFCFMIEWFCVYDEDIGRVCWWWWYSLFVVDLIFSFLTSSYSKLWSLAYTSGYGSIFDCFSVRFPERD